MTCVELRARLTEYFAEELAPAEAGELRAHLVDCAGCRGAAEAAEPTTMFARLADPDGGDGSDGAEFLAGVRRVIELRQAERVARARRRWVSAPALRWAAALLLVSLGGGSAYLAWRSARPAEVIATPTAVPLELPASLEGLDRPEARVYELTSTDDELRVVMIVDEGLDL